MKHIQWITFNAFIDTDIYIVKELAEFYSINWHVIRSGNDKFEYASMIDEMKQKENLTINLHVCGRRLRKIESAFFFTRLLRNLKCPMLIWFIQVWLERHISFLYLQFC